MIFPPKLTPGATIGIAASARKVQPADLAFAKNFVENAGYKVAFAETLFSTSNQFAGSDEARAAGINELIHNPEVSVIWLARGGYGSVRLLDRIDWEALKNQPKWICGYSDVTAIHSFIHRNLSMASLHSPMLLGFEEIFTQAQNGFLEVLQHGVVNLEAKSHHLNKKGNATAPLVGGNLSVIYSTLGSDAQLDTTGKILVIEDLDEYLYHIDRMMMALKRAGMLNNLAGLVVGGFTDMRDNTIPFGTTAEEIVAEAVQEFNFPVAFNFPAGHIKNNNTLVFGADATLRVDAKTTLTQNIWP